VFFGKKKTTNNDIQSENKNMYFHPLTERIANPTEFRTNVRNVLAKRLDLNLEVETDLMTATNLERGIFNFAIKESNQRKIVKKWENPAFVFIYADRMKVLFFNLECIGRSLRAGDVTVEQLATMSHQELRPDRWAELINRKQIRDASKYNRNVGSSTDMFTCKKCQSKNCTYCEVQTRSADEPATIFVSCLDCGKNWKM